MRELIDAFDRGDTARAIALHHQLMPAYTGFFRTQGVITAKAALHHARASRRSGAAALGQCDPGGDRRLASRLRCGRPGLPA